MHRPRRTAPVVGGVLVASSVLTACGPVEVDVPDLPAEDRAACEAFAADLPDTLLDEEQVEVEPADAPAAAYGDPPIVVRCGAGEPEGFGKGAQCEIANDVPWYIPPEQYDDQSLDLVITAAWHTPRAQVLLPAEYRGREAGAMAVLAPLVEEHLEQVDDCDL